MRRQSRVCSAAYEVLAILGEGVDCIAAIDANLYERFQKPDGVDSGSQSLNPELRELQDIFKLIELVAKVLNA